MSLRFIAFYIIRCKDTNYNWISIFPALPVPVRADSGPACRQCPEETDIESKNKQKCCQCPLYGDIDNSKPGSPGTTTAPKCGSGAVVILALCLPIQSHRQFEVQRFCSISHRTDRRQRHRNVRRRICRLPHSLRPRTRVSPACRAWSARGSSHK